MPLTETYCSNSACGARAATSDYMCVCVYIYITEMPLVEVKLPFAPG
jgi:hypothetical protein